MASACNDVSLRVLHFLYGSNNEIVLLYMFGLAGLSSCYVEALLDDAGWEGCEVICDEEGYEDLCDGDGF